MKIANTTYIGIWPLNSEMNGIAEKGIIKKNLTSCASFGNSHRGFGVEHWYDVTKSEM